MLQQLSITSHDSVVPDGNLVPRAFLINEEFQRGEGPGKLWSRVRQILQKSWSICLRAGFLEINTGGAIKSSRQDDGGLLNCTGYLYSFSFYCNFSLKYCFYTLCQTPVNCLRVCFMLYHHYQKNHREGDVSNDKDYEASKRGIHI